MMGNVAARLFIEVFPGQFPALNHGSEVARTLERDNQSAEENHGEPKGER